MSYIYILVKMAYLRIVCMFLEREFKSKNKLFFTICLFTLAALSLFPARLDAPLIPVWFMSFCLNGDTCST